MKTKKITVKPGDTLWSLAQTHLKDGQRWRDLFLMNAPLMVFKHGNDPNLVGPNFVYDGDELFIVTDIEFEPSGNV